MKKTFSAFALSVAIALAAIAQLEPTRPTSGVHFISRLDGTATLPALSTNTFIVDSTTNVFGAPGTTSNLVQVCTEFDYVAFTFSFTGSATSTNSLLIHKSYDGGATFETMPAFQYLNIAPGVASFRTNDVLDLRGVSHIAFVLRNSGTTAASDALLKVNLKSPKWGQRQATQ
jgi:hypothetical protein